jgi:arylsulfatase A-like enzyme
MDVHEFVYDIESALFGTTNSDIYDAAIRHEDYVIESLVMELRTQGLRENTLIVIASDHGEAFGERGFEGHAREIHRETTEVPLIFSFPFDLAEGVVVNTRTANVDIWPTLFDLIGLPTLDDIDGVSRLDDILSGGPRPPVPDHRPNRAFSLLDQTWGTNGAASLTSIAITEGPLRYVIGHERGRWIDYLFDSEADPKELKNLAKQSPEIVEKFRALAKEFANQNVKWADGAPELEIDEMQLNQLRALGYQFP